MYFSQRIYNNVFAAIYAFISSINKLQKDKIKIKIKKLCSFNLNTVFKVKLNVSIKIKHNKFVREIRTINFGLKMNQGFKNPIYCNW